MIVGFIDHVVDAEGVLIPDDEDHCFALVEADLIVVVVIENGGLMVVALSLFPGDVDHAAVCQEEAVLAVLLDADAEVGRTFRPGLRVRPLDQNVVEGHLLACSGVALRCPVNGLVILAVLFIVSERGLCDREALPHVKFFGADCVRVLFQCVSLLAEGEMLVVIVCSSVLHLESGLGTV